MFITIITVCFNSEKTIERTIKSVLNQTYDNYEYIIIDGVSTDNTLNIVKKYEPLFDGKMRIVSEKDNGIYDAMNKGISLAKGDLIGMINSDDYYENYALEKINAAYSGNKYEIIYGMQNNYTEDGKLRSIVFNHHDFLEEEMINHPTCFVTKKLYDDKGAFSLEYKASSDYDFMLRMKKDTEVVFTPIPEVVSDFTLGGMSSNINSRLETFKIWKKYGCISNK
ncbi:MAG: glycosyltransferase [Ruminococcaceae bacterium]|nr:glycosyltransferase [Oscillospiraceae bacterium]